MKLIKLLIILVLLIADVFALTPPPTIPSELYHEFTLNGAIPVIYRYSDEAMSQTTFTPAQIDYYMEKAQAKETQFYGATDLYLYQAFEKYLSSIQDKNVAVMGSVLPWYESILLTFGAKPTTIDYKKIICKDPRVEALMISQYDKNPRLFDAVVSISSFTHEGLSRYGDPINPAGDLLAMQKAKGMLKPGGLLFLAVPVGKDCLVWNLHRVYGHIRLKALLKGWHIVEYFGFTSQNLDVDAWENVHQPVFVLTPN